MANTIPTVSGLDYTDVKGALRSYLRQQSTFRDYDWDASNISTLVGVLAYNQFLHSFYLNMVAIEAHLDSARLLDSAIAQAKSLGYTPQSPKSSHARLNLSIPVESTSGSFTIPKRTQFSAENSNGTFTFSTRSGTVYYSSTNTFTVSNLNVYEGSYIDDAYVYNSSNEAQKLLLQSNSADIDSLSVSVTTPAGDSSTTWKKAENLYGLDGTSNTYFLQGADGGRFEVVFGDGVFGRKPADGSIITLEYMTTEGSEGNGCETFVLDDDLGQENNTTIASPFIIETVSESAGGSTRENINSIKFRAPRHYQTQESAITTKDYEAIVLERFQDVGDCHTYGGETVSGSVQYGRAFVAVAGRGGTPVVEARKQEIKEFLESRSSMGMEAVMVSSENLYVRVTVVAHVDNSRLSVTLAQMATAVQEAISDYEDESLGKFKGHFLPSRVVENIHEVDDSILSVEITPKIVKIADLGLNESKAVTIELRNAIEKGVVSTDFTSATKRYRITDILESVDPDGTLYLLEVNPLLSSQKYSVIGSVDYDEGKIEISAIKISSFVTGTGLTFTTTPVSRNVYAKKNDVITIDYDNSSITAVTE